MKINRTVIIIILSGIYIGLVLSGAFRKLEYLEGDVSDKTDLAKKYDALIEQGVTAEEAIEIVLNSPRSPPPVEVREKIDAWIKRNNLDMVGNPIGTMYTGGTPLFDENTGMSIDRYVYIISNNGHKPWDSPPMASPEEVVVRYEGAEEEREEALETVMNSIGPSPETTTDEASDTKNMNIGIGISVGVLALFLILFTYYKLRRGY